MLSEISQDGTITWYCQSREFQDEPSCNVLNTASLDNVVYQEMPGATQPGQGAVIALPACSSCGAQTRLKADYSLKELYHATIRYEENGMSVYALPYRYMLNLKTHWLLYQQGKAAYPPIVEMAPQDLLEHPTFAGVNPSLVQALWFGFTAVKAVAPLKLENRQVLKLLL